MTQFLVVDANDQPVSIGSVIANPLPAGLTAVSLTRAQFDGLRDGSLRYEAGQFVVVPPDPQVVVEADLNDKLRARLATAKADITEIVGDATAVPPIVGTIDQANADIAAAQAAIAAAQAIIDGTGTNAQKNAARQDRRDAQQDLAIARLTKRSEQRDLNALRTLNSVTRLVLRADLLDSNEGT